jgi:hypothetical protein
VKFIRGLGRTIDWLGMRVTLLLVLGLVGYAVLQPLIWSEVLNRKLPAVSSDLASLVGIVVTIMSLVLAVFGVVAYQLVERRTEARLEERATKLHDELREQAESDAAELKDNLMMNAVTANAKLFINISYQAFLSYEDLWKKAGYVDAYIKNDPDVQAFLNSAIGNAEKARDQMLSVPERLHARSEYGDGIRICTGNLVYFLATRASKGDEKRVLEMVTELDQQGIDTNKLETVAWAYLRYSEPGQTLWDKGLAKLVQARRAAGPQSGSQDKQRQRYERLFADQDQPVRDAITAALAGQDPPPLAADQSAGS